jgi:hypothetical protein
MFNAAEGTSLSGLLEQLQAKVSQVDSAAPLIQTLYNDADQLKQLVDGDHACKRARVDDGPVCLTPGRAPETVEQGSPASFSTMALPSYTLRFTQSSSQNSASGSLPTHRWSSQNAPWSAYDTWGYLAKGLNGLPKPVMPGHGYLVPSDPTLKAPETPGNHFPPTAIGLGIQDRAEQVQHPNNVYEIYRSGENYGNRSQRLHQV